LFEIIAAASGELAVQERNETEARKKATEAREETEQRKRANRESVSERRKEEHLRNLLASRAAIGKTSAEVIKLLGAPEHTQEVGGERYWYYTVKEQNWQLIFSGATVASENQY
jgi:outer membrane protein assembly factor BamE (lipoprotein component of BamABCDE complex)